MSITSGLIVGDPLVTIPLGVCPRFITVQVGMGVVFRLSAITFADPFVKKPLRNGPCFVTSRSWFACKVSVDLF